MSSISVGVVIFIIHSVGLPRRCYKEQIVIGTYNQEIEQELKEKYPHLLRGASVGSARDFVLTQYLGVNIFDKGDFSCLQIPMSYELKGIALDLVAKTITKRAHRRGIAVQYWTINDPEEMAYLQSIGADAIMTDVPDEAADVLVQP